MPTFVWAGWCGEIFCADGLVRFAGVAHSYRGQGFAGEVLGEEGVRCG